jgi:CRISPR-associated protein Csm3
MHRLACNELRLDFAIRTVSPLCIQTDDDPARFARTVHPYIGQSSIYIPSGTLKGTFRRAAERVLTGAGIDCCDAEHPCSERDSVKRAADGPSVYRALCSGCRIFGSSAMRSHLTVTDAFPASLVRPTISRDNGEVVVDETFYSTLVLRNFERWQAGLLSLMITRMNLADVQIGARRSEGMGCIVISYTCLSLLYPGLNLDPHRQEALKTRLHGVGQFMGPQNKYGFTYPDVSDMPDLPEEAEFSSAIDYAAVLITADKDEEDAEQVSHALIDGVLTNQALAWGSYVRANKSARQGQL